MIVLALVAVILVALAAIGNVHVHLLPWWVVPLPAVALIGEIVAAASLLAALVIIYRAPRGWPGPAVTP